MVHAPSHTHTHTEHVEDHSFFKLAMKDKPHGRRGKDEEMNSKHNRFLSLIYIIVKKKRTSLLAFVFSAL
jgi:hypothetical protein